MFPKKIWKQAAVVLCITAVFPMVLLGGWLLFTAQKAIKTTVLRDQQQIAIRAASEINRFIERPKDLLRSTASILGTLHSDAWRQETALVELALNEEIFSRLSVVDLGGNEAATSDLGSLPMDFSKNPTYLNARLDKVSFSKIHLTNENIPHMYIGVPIKRFGQVSGVLMAEVSLRGFWKIVDEIQIGQSGEAYVISETGLLIAHPDKKLVMQQRNLSQDIVVRNVLNGQTGSIEYKDHENRDWLKAYAPISLTGWGFIAKQSAKDAYSFLYIMYVQVMVLVFLTVLAAVWLCIYLAPRLVAPIHMLSKKMSLVANGDLEHYIPVTRLDEIGKLLDSFNEMTAKLKESRETEHLITIGKAATAITHELKNSLLMAGTYIQLLQERHKDPEFLRQYLTVVPAELDNWKNMLNEISDYAQKKPLHMAPLEINGFLKDFGVFTEIKMGLHGIRLTVELPESTIYVLAHSQKLRQVLTNLTINAMEAMPDGGSLYMSTYIREQRVEIKIRDTGPGIPGDKLNKIFEPFYSSQPNKLGLGLSICREIMEKHGGNMRAESIEGTGSAIFVSMPVLKVVQPAILHCAPNEMIK